MSNYSSRSKNIYLLILIIFLAFILRIIWLDRADMQGDDAVYAFTSVGYYDYLNSEQQTTPLQWFGYFPWWSKLSFHGAPPLVFLIQHFFFFIFGVSTFIARLPFVLFGTLSVYLLYLVGKKLFNSEKVGLVSAFILAIFNYHIWISRTGYLEGILTFFIILSFYYFLKLLENNSPKNYFLVGLSLGLAFLCKYTMLFLLPAFFFYLLIFNRNILKNKRILLAIIVFLIVISPVIFYNIMVYKTRGHLDLQFSQIFGMDIRQDWPMFARGEKRTFNDYIFNLKGIYDTLKFTLGKIYFNLFFVSLLLIITNLFLKKEEARFFYLLIFLFIFLTLQFSITGAANRFLPVFTPLISIIIAYFLIQLYYFLYKIKAAKKYKYFILLIFFFIISLISFFTILEDVNTNLTKVKMLPVNSSLRQENYGFRQLENYFQTQLSKKLEYDDSKTLYIYDDRLNWFCRFWYFYRKAEYNNKNYAAASNFLDLSNTQPGYWESQYNNFYYIHGVNTYVDQIKIDAGDVLKNILNKMNVQPVLIDRDDGELAFEVYKFH